MELCGHQLGSHIAGSMHIVAQATSEVAEEPIEGYSQEDDERNGVVEAWSPPCIKLARLCLRPQELTWLNLSTVGAATWGDL